MSKSEKSLRQHKEIKYSKDLSSYQIWLVLNTLLMEASSPFVVYSNMSIETALSCLSISTDKRRKVGYFEATEMLKKTFCELAMFVEFNDKTKDMAKKEQELKKYEEKKLELMEFILNSGVERNIIIDHIAYSLSRLPSNHFLKTKVDFVKLTKHVENYLDYYELFKQDIVFRFYYFIEAFSNKNHYVKSINGLNTSKQGMFNAYIISAIRAIDRFIPYVGTIASYIETWFKHAQGSSDFIIYDDEVFNLKRSIRKSVQEGEKHINNKVIPIADRENEIHEIPDENVSSELSTFPEFSRHIAKLPNSTIVFLAQAIPYILSPEQIKRIEDNNLKFKHH